MVIHEGITPLFIKVKADLGATIALGEQVFAIYFHLNEFLNYLTI